MKKTKRIAVSLPIALVEKLYHSWEASEFSNFSEFISDILKRELKNETKTK